MLRFLVSFFHALFLVLWHFLLKLMPLTVPTDHALVSRVGLVIGPGLTARLVLLLFKVPIFENL